LAGDKVVEEKIAITTRYIEDVAKDFGHEEELSKGSEGKIVTTTTYKVNPTNGTVTEGETTRKQTDMLERVVKKGTKPKVTETSVAHMTRYERDEESPAGEKSVSQKGKDGKAQKCNLCAEKLERGEEPACVAGCPCGVLKLVDSNVSDSAGMQKEMPGFKHFFTKPNIRFYPRIKRNEFIH